MTLYRWPNWTLIAVGCAAGLACIPGFPPRVPLIEAVLVAVLLPSCAAVIYVSSAVILAKDAANTENTALSAAYGGIVFAVIFFIVTLHVLTVALLSGALPPVFGLARAPIVLFGLLAIWIGNLLPRTRPNLALGIRTRRTLSDRDAWIRTHRVAGYLAVSLGVLFVVCGLFLSKQHLENVLGPVSIAAALLLAAEHLRSRTTSGASKEMAR